MITRWKTFDAKSKETILEKTSTKPLYKIKFKDGKVSNAFVKNHKLVYNSYGLKPVLNMDDIVEYAEIGEK